MREIRLSGSEGGGVREGLSLPPIPCHRSGYEECYGARASRRAPGDFFTESSICSIAGGGHRSCDHEKRSGGILRRSSDRNGRSFRRYE